MRYANIFVICKLFKLYSLLTNLKKLGKKKKEYAHLPKHDNIFIIRIPYNKKIT